MAWPPARGATAADLADAGSWPNEPEWSEAWPLFGFTPPGWSLSAAEADAGVGMSVDRAWAITRGTPTVTLAVVDDRHDLSDPVLARAWRLNAGEFPDAGDRNGNGRLDVEDFTDVPDVNGNGALDLEDLIRARADGLDQDGNGRADDLCGWDFARDAGLTSSADAGVQTWRLIAAPVNDGRPGIGACPDCTLVPFVSDERTLSQAIRFATDAGVRALLLPPSDAEVTGDLRFALGDARRSMLVVMTGAADGHAAPLSLEQGVITPRALTASSTRDTATSRTGCGGRVIPGEVSVSSATCADEAAARLVGIAGLVFSVNPALSADTLRGLLGTPRVDAHFAVSRAEAGLAPELFAPASLQPASLRSPPSAAATCTVEDPSSGERRPTTLCGWPSPWPSGNSLSELIVRFVENVDESSWVTPIIAPAAGTLSLQALAPGSGPPRFVDLDGTFSETVLVTSSRGLLAAAPRGEDVLSPNALGAGRAPLAIGDVNGDRVLDVVHVGVDDTLRVFSFAATPPVGFPEVLAAPLAGAPLIIGNALVTLEVNGRLTHRLGGERWTFELQSPQVSGPAAGRIDGDDVVDFAIANGVELRVLLSDARGPTSASWSVASRATQALLGNLAGDAALEVVADAVYDARGSRLLELEDWRVPAVPPALARLGESPRRSLVQVERDGTRFELVRYDVEAALAAGDSIVGKQRLFTLSSAPSRGGFAVADQDGDGAPDVILPTEDGTLFVIRGDGQPGRDAPHAIPGTVFSGAAVGVADDQLQYAVRTTRGDLVRWLGRGLPGDISWESAGHDRGNTWNAETPLPERRISGLGVKDPPIIGGPTCGCGSTSGLGLLALLFLFRLRRSTC
jgi:hypothetical protein